MISVFKRLFSLLRSNRFIRGSLIFSLASLLANVFSYFFNLIVVRAVSVSDYGEYSSALSYLMLFSVPLGVIGMVVIKKVGDKKASLRQAYSLSLEKRLLKDLFGYCLPLSLGFLIVLIATWQISNLRIDSVVFIGLMIVFGLFSTFYQALQQAYKNFFSAGFLAISFGGFKLISGGIVYLFFPYLLPLYLAMILATVCVVLLGKKMISQKINDQKYAQTIQIIDWLSFIGHRSFYLPVLTVLGMTILINLDLMYVKKFFSDQEAGIFAGISLLGKIILYFSAPVLSVSYSFFTGSESKHSSLKILFFTTLVFGLIGLSSTLVYLLFPGLVIWLILGEKYAQVSHLIWLVSIFGAVYTLSSLYSQYWLARGSLVSLLSLPIAFLQFILLSIFSETFFQILLVDIFCATLLFIFYLGLVFRSQTKKNAANFLSEPLP